MYVCLFKCNALSTASGFVSALLSHYTLMGADKNTKPILFSTYSGSETNNWNTTR